MTTTQNVRAVLSHLGIVGVVIVEELPDRVRALDALGELRKHINTHQQHWMKDPMLGGHLIDPFHGSNATGSWREKQRPSLQVVDHPISQINPNHPPEDHYCELDVDFSPPDSPLNFLRHTAEIGENLVRHRLTDEDEAGRLLAERFQKENVSA